MVLDGPVGWERHDYSAEHWKGPPENAIGYWRGQVSAPSAPEKPKAVDVDLLLEWFDQLASSTTAEQQRLRYVLALLLVRRKALKLLRVENDAEQEYLIVTRRSDGGSQRVLDLAMSEEDVRQIEQRILELQTIGPAALAGPGP